MSFALCLSESIKDAQRINIFNDDGWHICLNFRELIREMESGRTLTNNNEKILNYIYIHFKGNTV